MALQAAAAALSDLRLPQLPPAQRAETVDGFARLLARNRRRNAGVAAKAAAALEALACLAGHGLTSDQLRWILRERQRSQRYVPSAARDEGARSSGSDHGH